MLQCSNAPMLLHAGEFPSYCTSSYIKVTPIYFEHYMVYVIWSSSRST